MMIDKNIVDSTNGVYQDSTIELLSDNIENNNEIEDLKEIPFTLIEKTNINIKENNICRNEEIFNNKCPNILVEEDQL